MQGPTLKGYNSKREHKKNTLFVQTRGLGRKDSTHPRWTAVACCGVPWGRGSRCSSCTSSSGGSLGNIPIQRNTETTHSDFKTTQLYSASKYNTQQLPPSPSPLLSPLSLTLPSGLTRHATHMGLRDVSLGACWDGRRPFFPGLPHRASGALQNVKSVAVTAPSWICTPCRLGVLSLDAYLGRCLVGLCFEGAAVEGGLVEMCLGGAAWAGVLVWFSICPKGGLIRGGMKSLDSGSKSEGGTHLCL